MNKRKRCNHTVSMFNSDLKDVTRSRYNNTECVIDKQFFNPSRNVVVESDAKSVEVKVLMLLNTNVPELGMELNMVSFGT